MRLDQLFVKHEEREKTAFSCSDYGKTNLDLYYSFIGEKKTNPIEWFTMVRLGAGKGAEENLLKVLKDSGIVNEDYVQEEDGRVEMSRYGFEIHGYIDAITKEGLPVEIKTINNKNTYDILSYQQNKPRENYVGQLAMYMDFLGVDTGYLFVASLDGLNTFLFECKKVGDLLYKCGETMVDLRAQYESWAKLYKENIVPKKEPNVFEYRYKIPVEEIDWSKISDTDISKARTNKKVIGDGWQIQYSPYKDLILKRQGVTPGYSDEELEFIKKVTKGYSAK